MVNLAPSLFKEGSALNFHIVSFILYNIMKRTVDASGNDIDFFFIIDAAVTGALVYFRPFGNIVVSGIVVKICQPVFYIDVRIVFKCPCNVAMKVNPVLPVQKEYTDTD